MKSRIIAATVDEMNIRSIKFTIDTIASRLGVSKKTLYQYYASKEALIEATIDTLLEDLYLQRQLILNGRLPLKQKIAAILTIEPKLAGKLNAGVFEDIMRLYPKQWERIMQFRREQLTDLEALLEQGQQEGIIRPLICAKVVSQILPGAVIGLLEPKFLEKNDFTFCNALKALTDIILNGVLVTSQSINGGEMA